MQEYAAIAGKPIASHEVKRQALQDEVVAGRRLIQSLELNLREAQERVIRQQAVKRVSQFILLQLESEGTFEVRIKTKSSMVVESPTILACRRVLSFRCYRGTLTKW